VAKIKCSNKAAAAAAAATAAALLPHLTPAARGSTQVDCMPYSREYIEHLVDLQQLKSAPRPPALLLGFSVINVALVLAGFSHR
jgi:hypothetical protein